MSSIDSRMAYFRSVRDREGVAMAVLVQAVQQRLRALARQERGAVEESGGRLEGSVFRALGAPHYLLEVESEEAAVGPLAPLD